MTHYRHEWKHEIDRSDMIALRQRLKAVAKPDAHAVEGVYFIRSLYFDNAADQALREKIDGVSVREKFRIRYYNGDSSLIHLEKKCKCRGLCSKELCQLTKEEAQSIADGEILWMKQASRALVRELYGKMLHQGLKPKTIVDYTREAYIFPPGNVRVTMDYDIRTGIRGTDFLHWDCMTVPAGDPTIILEVKWDEFLPSVIRDTIQMMGRQSSAFSKYARCRIYG